jgi:hypothetical protein
VAFCAVLFFVASLSFGLGYQADRELNALPIIIEKCSSNDASAPVESSVSTP